ncbi:MAG: hypothetical protein K9N05_08020 [Candidatus Marinimicrobia bacterium]|nr:hypothetical protein [Candidatus Neomarinimicrobiota bacterium]
MKHKLTIFAIILFLVLIWGCGPVYPDGNTETSYPVPEFSDELLTYNTLRQELHCEVQVHYDSAVTDLRAGFTLTGFEETTFQTTLNDSGKSGDAMQGDNIFSKNISLTRIDSMDGQIIARYDIYEGGISIKTLNDTIQIVANLPPFITEINMPDTIVRPRIGTKDLLISLSVDDPNGIQDVINAYFQVKNNSTGQWSSDYPMNDMGTLGDATAGDGVFSTGLEISSDNSAVTNYFRFRIKDTASNFSDWSLDSVVVR